MTVWVVQRAIEKGVTVGDEYFVIGVFSDERKARACMEKSSAVLREKPDGYFDSGSRIVGRYGNGEYHLAYWYESFELDNQKYFKEEE